MLSFNWSPSSQALNCTLYYTYNEFMPTGQRVLCTSPLENLVLLIWMIYLPKLNVEVVVVVVLVLVTFESSEIFPRIMIVSHITALVLFLFMVVRL